MSFSLFMVGAIIDENETVFLLYSSQTFIIKTKPPLQLAAFIPKTKEAVIQGDGAISAEWMCIFGLDPPTLGR